MAGSLSIEYGWIYIRFDAMKVVNQLEGLDLRRSVNGHN